MTFPISTAAPGLDAIVATLSTETMSTAPVDTTNALLLKGAVKALTAAFDSGIKTESAIAATVKSICFLACDKAGVEMSGLVDGAVWDLKTSRAHTGPYTMVIKELIMAGKRPFRDSEDSFAKEVKGKSGPERIKGVNAYIKANKAKDVVWSVAQVRGISRKIVMDATANHAATLINISIMESADAQSAAFTEFFEGNYGVTFKELSSFGKGPAKVRGEGSETIVKAIGKLDDLALLEIVQAALTARILSVKSDAAKMGTFQPLAVSNEGEFDNEIAYPFQVAA